MMIQGSCAQFHTRYQNHEHVNCNLTECKQAAHLSSVERKRPDLIAFVWNGCVGNWRDVGQLGAKRRDVLFRFVQKAKRLWTNRTASDISDG